MMRHTRILNPMTTDPTMDLDPRMDMDPATTDPTTMDPTRDLTTTDPTTTDPTTTDLTTMNPTTMGEGAYYEDVSGWEGGCGKAPTGREVQNRYFS